MDTQRQAGSSISTRAKGCDWQAALGSDDPAQQWAASCSIAAVVNRNQRSIPLSFPIEDEV